MLTNYLRIAWRRIISNKLYSIINVVGLTLGICSCLLIYLVTSYDFSFDNFLPDKDRIYRIVGDIRDNQGNTRFLNSPFVEVAGFQSDIPGFEAKSGFFPFGREITIKSTDGLTRKYSGRWEGSDAEASVLTGPDFFKVFQYTWLVGQPNVLDSPFKVVLTESAARRYFGQGPLDEMIGMTVVFKDSLQVRVGGIVKDWDKNSDFKYDQFISLRTAPLSSLKSLIPTDDWTSLQPTRSQAFVKLAKGITAAQVNAGFANYISKHVKQVANFPTSAKLRMYLQPLTAIHFTKEYHREDDGDHIDKPYLPILYALMGLALFILALASINFINLSTAQAAQRTKEVGIRKVMGSGRRPLILQFLFETLVLTVFAVFLSVILVFPALFALRGFIPPGVKFHFTDPGTLLFLFLLTMLTALLAGYYPARVLSSYLPVLSLKGPAFQKGSKKGSLRKVLIVFQFTISITFIIGGLVIGNQLRFMQKIDKGFNSDGIVTLTNEDATRDEWAAFTEKLSNIPGVQKVVRQSNNPMSFSWHKEYVTFREKKLIEREVFIQETDPDFMSLYQIKMLAGGSVDSSDSIRNLCINETYARLLGFDVPRKALMHTLYIDDRPWLIGGVVGDFVERSFHETIQPLVILHRSQEEKMIALRLPSSSQKGAKTKEILSAMEKEWLTWFPATRFHYSFLNDSLESLYGQEKRSAWLVNMAMIIAIFISCMGIFGLGMWTAEKRAKEIGIRKVLGASVASITALLTKDFVILIIIALVIASPLSWYCLNRWLMDFAFRITIGAWVFVVAGLSAILIAIITISFQAVKAAVANPVEALRTE